MAKKLNTEIISCDSMQIYKDMNIGTAKPTIEEMQGIKHYMLDFLSPEERFSVSDYTKETNRIIKKLTIEGKIPIVVGGTGLYIDSLVYGIQFPEIAYNEHYRKWLEDRVQKEGLEVIYKEAMAIDPEAVEHISKTDTKRILRILEIYHHTGKTKTQQNEESLKKGVEFDYHVFGLKWDRQKLYERINKRVDIMIEQGLIEEVRKLLVKYKKFPTAMQGLGYKEVVAYLENKITKEEMIETVKQQTRRYAKRQITWFKRNKDIVWLEAETIFESQIETILKNMKIAIN